MRETEQPLAFKPWLYQIAKNSCIDAFRRSKMVIIDHKPVVQSWWYPYPDDWFYEDGGRKHV